MSFMEDIEYFSRVSRTIIISARMVGILVLSLIISLLAFAAGVWILFSSDVEQRLVCVFYFYFFSFGRKKKLDQFRSQFTIPLYLLKNKTNKQGVWQAMTAAALMTLDTLDTSWMSEAQPNVTLYLFVLFYVIVQAVILNVMIGILSDNFETVFKDRFREEEFKEIMKHDPNCTGWGDPDASWIGVIVCRDFPKAMCCCQDTRGRHRYLLWQKNFWKRYSQTLLNFDNYDIRCSLSAYKELNKLVELFCSGKGELSVYSEPESEEVEGYKFMKRKTMLAFIEGGLEATRVRLLEEVLITIPCAYLAIDRAPAWADVLMEHKVWRQHNEKWARFENDEFGDLIDHIVTYESNQIQQPKTPITAQQRWLSKLSHLPHLSCTSATLGSCCT